MYKVIPRYCRRQYRPGNEPDSRGNMRVSKQGRRFFRTVVLGTFALAALVWMAMDQFGIAGDEMLDLLLVTVLVVGLVIFVAACVAGLWIGLRKLLGRR